MRPGEWFLAAILFGWWLLSLAFQLSPAVRRRLAAPYELGLISGYRFFAPTPLALDTHVEVRSLDATGPTPWRRPWPFARRGWHTCFWNPRARTADGRLILARLLVSKAERRGRPAALDSSPYRQLLQAASLVAPARTPVQFRILAGKDFDPARPPAPAFLSEWHGPGE